MSRRTIVVGFLLAICALTSSLIPTGASAAPAPGCTAVGGKTCTYISGGGRVAFVAVTTTWWGVAWSKSGSFVYCGSGTTSTAKTCVVPKGAEVFAATFDGVITVRDLPGAL